MARVPITVMGFRCDRCSHEWIPRGDSEAEPRVCPKCKSPYWNTPKKTSMLTYDEFRDRIAKALRGSDGELTWTEIRTTAKLSQMFPNNQWVHRLERDIALERKRDAHGIIRWRLRPSTNATG